MRRWSISPSAPSSRCPPAACGAVEELSVAGADLLPAWGAVGKVCSLRMREKSWDYDVFQLGSVDRLSPVLTWPTDTALTSLSALSPWFEDPVDGTVIRDFEQRPKAPVLECSVTADSRRWSFLCFTLLSKNESPQRGQHTARPS